MEEEHAALQNDRVKTIFVVGLGMVGIAFIEKLLDLDELHRYKIITCGEEMFLAYNRVALTEYFQHRSVEKLYVNQADWYEKQSPDRFEFRVGEAVTSLNPDAHTVLTNKGQKITYDYCVLATGSEATIPYYVDTAMRGIFVYRNLSDLNKILEYSQLPGVKGGKAIVVGGGLLGLEAAKAVFDLEGIKDVVIINRKAYPLSRQLDAHGGAIVLRRIESLGVKVLTNTSARACVSLPDQPDTFAGLELDDGTVLDAQIVIFAIGISPRDDLARQAGIKCDARGGVIVDDSLQTSAHDVFAIGECASWNSNTYGLIAPGIEMADILSFNLTQVKTAVGGFKPRQMNNPDLSTKLKLMGVDVASFGDFLRDKLEADNRARASPHRAVTTVSQASRDDPAPVAPKNDAAIPRRRHGLAAHIDGPIETITYRDPFAGVYKKYIFTADGKYLLGGMMVGDTDDFVKLVALVKKKKALELPPSQFILGANKSDDAGADLDDDTQVCSCHNVTKGQIVQSVRNGITSISDLKAKTKAGTGCGGCMPLVTNIFKAEMAKAGHASNNNLCPHFNMTRVELFSVVQIKKLKTFAEIMNTVGLNKDALGCEICKPAIGSILSSLWNEHIMNPAHHQNQDTNDRFLANIQRNGTFSVIPRVPGGEITPDKLIVLGQVAKEHGLYTKITGAQRVDLFGAQKADLPDIWEALVKAGFESGHAYGKSLRTVKSCVGTSWCRYGIGDSVGMAIALEERYKGIRSPHKLKGGVSGCVRECAEAQNKDFGLIATDKGWNLFVGGNGGAIPKHAQLFAKDVPPSQVIRLIDRYLIYYIRTADKLMRTARWIEQFEGGIERLRKIIIEDELGICADLDRQMDELVGTYQDEWKTVVEDPERRKQFRQFVNTDERRPQMEQIVERGQNRPANWAKEFPPVKFTSSDVRTPKDQWKWRQLASVEDLSPTEVGTTSAAVKYGDSQLAIFHVPKRGYFATQQMCPHKRAFVLDHGLIGDDPSTGAAYVSCPLHKRNWDLATGACLNDNAYSIIAFDVKIEGSAVFVLLPEPDELDAVIGTEKWMIRQATADIFNRGAGSSIEVVGPSREGAACGGSSSLEW